MPYGVQHVSAELFSKIIFTKTPYVVVYSRREATYISSTMSIHKFDHHIQATIFANLRESNGLRYRDLKDPSIESSQFVYHLKELIKSGLIEKYAHGSYRLTKKGLSLAQHFSSEKNALREGVLTYSLICIRSKSGKWLLVKRKKQPFYNYYASLSGKVHIGETLRQAAARECSILPTNIDLHYKGYVSILISGEAIETHISGPVWFADDIEEFDTTTVQERELYWANWQNLPYEQFIPGWREIVDMIESPDANYLDLMFTI